LIEEEFELIKSDIVRGRRGDTEAKNSEKSPDVYTKRQFAESLSHT